MKNMDSSWKEEQVVTLGPQHIRQKSVEHSDHDANEEFLTLEYQDVREPERDPSETDAQEEPVLKSPAAKGKENVTTPSTTDFNISHEASVPHVKLGLGRIVASARNSLDLDDV